MKKNKIIRSQRRQQRKLTFTLVRRIGGTSLTLKTFKNRGRSSTSRPEVGPGSCAGWAPRSPPQTTLSEQTGGSVAAICS